MNVTESGPDALSGIYKKAKGGTELMYEALYRHVDKSLLDQFQIICSRVRHLEPNKPRVLWLHDFWRDPENNRLTDPNFVSQFDKLVFVSNHQFNSYRNAYGITYDQSMVIRNAIEPIPVSEKPKDKINIIYHTTPHRGLEILVPVFAKLAETNKDIHLHVYSSFSIYGWDHRDEPYSHIFEFCKNHPQITYYGAVSNDIVRAALQKAHIFAYPSIWPETSCIAAIEAMSARCVVVAPNYEALPETLHGYGFTYHWSEDVNVNANRFAKVLSYAIDNIRSPEVENHIMYQKQFSDRTHNWQQTGKEWSMLLRGILNEKPQN